MTSGVYIRRYKRTWKCLKQKTFTEEHKRNIGLSKVGTKLSKSHKKNIGIAHKGLKYKPWAEEDRLKITGELSSNWKGENVSYSGIHKWLVEKYGNPKICEKCKSTNKQKYDWANISGLYKRERDDFIGLCRSCHAKIDKSKNRMAIREIITKLKQ